MALSVKWAGIEYSLGACDALNLQDCKLAARSVALPRYLKLIECFLHVNAVTHEEGEHVVSVLDPKTVFSNIQMGRVSTGVCV